MSANETALSCGSAVSADAALLSVSLIVPTYKEAPNLAALIDRVETVRAAHHLDLELLIMDDDSRDGTDAIVEQLHKDWVRLVVRRGPRGLSVAVLDGFRLAAHEYVVVMDADLSHPPETIPIMLDHLRDGADFVIASRYLDGAGTDEAWGVFRWVNSKVATLLARPFTRVSDPMSGFFAFRRTLLDAAPKLNPVGYKIALELLVKCDIRQPVEVPIHFGLRYRGTSKLSLREQLRYLEHLRRLGDYKFGEWARFAQFAAVGLSGTAVNLLALTLLIALGVPVRVAVAMAIVSAMFSNFVLNRSFTFYYAAGKPWLRQLAGFLAACGAGALLNYGVVLLLFRQWPLLETTPQPAAVCGILAGMVVNYATNRYIVFRPSGD